MSEAPACQKYPFSFGPPPLRFARSDLPAVIPEINAVAKAVIANYGASNAAMLDVIFGKAPFELPLMFADKEHWRVYRLFNKW